MSNLPPPEQPPAPPRPWWKRELPLGIPVWVIGLVVALIVVVSVGAITKDGDDSDDSPSQQVELCDELAKPENARLHPSDWRRITDFTQSQLEAYVAQRCPAQSFKVLDD
jgi:hypothetical protein